MNKTIITQDSANVNTSPVETVFDKWGAKKSQSIFMSERMNKAGFMERGFRMLNCSTQLSYYKCPVCGDIKIKKANLCRDKLCPLCSWRLSIQRFANMAELMKRVQAKYPDLEYGFITLTVPNCYPRMLRATMKEMSAAWNRLANRKAIKEGVLGWARSVEITYNERYDTVHPHYHIIALARDKRVFREIIDIWLEVNRLGAIIASQDSRIIAADSPTPVPITNDDILSAVLETFKYAVKSNDLDNMPLSSFRSFVENVNGIRVTSFGGILKTLKHDLNLEFEEATTEEEITVCRSCGSTDLMESIAVWSFDSKIYNRITVNLYGK